MGGCIGCYSKPKHILSGDEPLKGKKPYAWTTSNRDMDNSVQSPRNITSISKSAQMHDSGGIGSLNNPSQFVNHGLLLWNQSREQWTASKKPEKKAQELRNPTIPWNASYDSLLGSNKPFRKPIPLAEMIDFLVDIWEQEGVV